VVRLSVPLTIRKTRFAGVFDRLPPHTPRHAVRLTVMLSAFAFLRLTTNSNFVGCCQLKRLSRVDDRQPQSSEGPFYGGIGILSLHRKLAEGVLLTGTHQRAIGHDLIAP